MNLFKEPVSQLNPKIGQVARLHHPMSDKIRPFVIVNKYKASGNYKVIGVYITSKYHSDYYKLGTDTFVDTRRVEEFSIHSVKQLGNMVDRKQYKDIIYRIRGNFKFGSYGKV